MKSNKAAAFTFEFIVSVVLILFFLYVVLYSVFSPAAENTDVLKSCEIVGGAVRDECNSVVSKIFSPASDEEKSQLCCVRRATATREKFDEWVEETGGYARSDVVISGGSGTDLIPENSAFVETNSLPAGTQIALTMNLKPYTNIPLTLETQEQFTLEGLHNFEDGTYCELYIRETDANWIARGNNAFGSFIERNMNCQPQQLEVTNGQMSWRIVRLELDGAIGTPGRYKAEFVVYEKQGGEILERRSLLFEVEQKTVQPISGLGLDIAPRLSIATTQYARESKTYCLVAVKVSGTSMTAPPQVEYEKSSSGCSAVNPGLRATVNDKITLESGQSYCLEVEQTYEDTEKNERVLFKSASIESRDCDFVYVQEISSTIYPSLPVDACEQSCAQYDQAACTQFSNVGRDPVACQFEKDCYYKANRGLLGVGSSCKDCSEMNIRSCSDYKNAESCMANQCLGPGERCEWITGVGAGCRPY